MPKNIRTWSIPMWTYIHSLPNLQGPNKEERIASIFGLLVSIIPCDTCREHTKSWIHNYPLHSVIQGGFPLYFYNMHNAVNLRTHSLRVTRSVLSRYRTNPKYLLSRLSSAILQFQSDKHTRIVLSDVTHLTENTL